MLLIIMGFPTWTLWGMGLAAAAALLTITLAFVGQSPRLLSRLGLTGARLDLRARNLTGYGLAFLLLATGFFIAGVPLGTGSAAVAGASTGEPPVAGTIAGEIMDQDGPVPTAAVQAAISALETNPAPTRSSSSGAMGGLAVPTAEALVTPEVDSATPDESAAPTTPPELLATPVEPVVAATEEAAPPPTAVPTATPAPTQTPTVTPSPTPIAGPTARINDNTSTLSIRKTPGGEPLVQVVRGDTVLLLPGHAFYGGGLWREVSTVDGVAGWVQEQFLDYEGEAE